MAYSYLIFDVAILILLVVLALRGAGRGLLLSLCGLVAIAVAFVGAGLTANYLAPKVATALEPRFAVTIERKLTEQFSPQVPSPALPTPSPTPAPDGSALDFPLEDVLSVLKDMGLYQDLVVTIEKAVAEGMADVAAGAAAAVAAQMAQSVAYMVIFLAVFITLSLLWALFSHALNLVARLPGLNLLNRTGGALFGLLKGCVLLFLFAWVLQYSGQLIPEATVEKTHLLKFFLHTSPMDLLAGH